MQRKPRKKGRAFSCLSLAALALFSILNVPLLLSPLGRFLGGETTLGDLARETRAAYVADVSFKSAFVDINGAYARLTGRRVYHGVSVLNNGMLDRDELAEMDMTEMAAGICRLEGALSESGIPFLYVQVPSKVDLADTLVPAGVENAANRNANALCGALEADGVQVLDLRPRLTGSVADVERYYYRTDHHWNADGAFFAFGEILARIASILPERAIDLSLTKAEQWERTVYADWFLGSHGKRVGRFFGGVDDLIVYTPRTPCTTSLSLPHKDFYGTGDFSELLIRTEYLERPDYFGADAHCVYLGGNYPLAVHENADAADGAHILLVKDSFSHPLEAMLSASLSRLDVIDPRYYRDGTVLEYAIKTRPDLVIVAINPSVFSDGAYLDYGA